MQTRKPNRVASSARVEQSRPADGPQDVQPAHWADAAPHRNRWAGVEVPDGRRWHRRPNLTI
jgi:hypothetical protein